MSRPLQVLVGREPASLSLKALGTAGVTTATSRRIFNATLTLIDNVGNPLPYLASALPQLNSEGWKFSSDGRMETTYPLKPNLVWHDGTALTAQDFAFTWRVYATPELTRHLTRPNAPARSPRWQVCSARRLRRSPFTSTVSPSWPPRPSAARPQVVQETPFEWNIHEWELTR